MESTLPSGSSVSYTEYTIKQKTLLQELDIAIAKLGIKIVINPIGDMRRFGGKLIALDVEHNEKKGFVGCGFTVDGSTVYYFSELARLLQVPLNTCKIIAHNGVSDFECLNTWGINVSDVQLSWDTMLIGHTLDSSQKDYSLKGMAKRELSIVYPSYDDIVGKRGLKTERITLDKQPLELVMKYNSLDVAVTWRIAGKQGINAIL